jgi:transposase
MLAPSTNTNSTANFIQNILVRNKHDPRQRPVLICDNHTSHTTPLNKAILERHFLYIPQPAYSSEFNSTEWLFAHIKRLYKKRLMRLAFRGDYTAADCKEVVRGICRNLPTPLVENIARANQSYIDRYKVLY